MSRAFNPYCCKTAGAGRLEALAENRSRKLPAAGERSWLPASGFFLPTRRSFSSQPQQRRNSRLSKRYWDQGFFLSFEFPFPLPLLPGLSLVCPGGAEGFPLPPPLPLFWFPA